MLVLYWNVPPVALRHVLSLLLLWSSSIKFHSLHAWTELTQKIKEKLAMVLFLRAIWVCLVAYGMQFDFFLHSERYPQSLGYPSLGVPRIPYCSRGVALHTLPSADWR